MVSAAITPMIENSSEELQDFERLVRHYRPAVFRFVLASLRNRDEAESLTQDCFLKAFRHRNQFRGESAVKTWLMQIAANLVRDVIRSGKFQFWRRIQANVSAQDLINSLSSRDASPEATAIARSQVEAIWAAVTKLSARQREVFLLRFVEDMNLTEIAQVLGTTEGSVKKHLFRGLDSVREKTRRLR